jgi:hypothetical protein
MASTLTCCLAEIVFLLVYTTRRSSSFKSFNSFQGGNKVLLAQDYVIKRKFLLILKQPQDISTWLRQPHGLLIKHIEPQKIRIYFTNLCALL